MTSHQRVGILCAVGLGIAAAAIAYVGSLPTIVRYRLAAQDPAILKLGAPVEVNGVVVGAVVERKVSGGAAEFGIEMNRDYARFAIPADSVAYLRRDAFLGPQGVHIELGKSKQRLRPGDRLLAETH